WPESPLPETFRSAIAPSEEIGTTPACKPSKSIAAAIQRQAGHLLVFDDVAKLCVGGVYLCGGASDFYSFGNRADHKLEVSSVLLVEYEFDSTLNGLFEPFRLDLNAVLFSDRDG